MLAYVARRLLLMVPTIFLLATVLFFMLRILPGDVAVGLLTTEEASATQEDIEEMREFLGLNDHPAEQYFRWIGEILRGDLGESPLFDATVTSILWSKMGITLELAVIAVLISLVWALPLGIVAALTRGSWLDQWIRILTTAGISLPNFWVAIMILLLLVAVFVWSPPVRYVRFTEDPIANLKMLLIPAAVIGFRSAAVITRMTRSHDVGSDKPGLHQDGAREGPQPMDRNGPARTPQCVSSSIDSGGSAAGGIGRRRSDY